MPGSGLEHLPEELLEYICRHLEGRRRSLSHFALASKTCHAAALPCIFRRIRLVIEYRAPIRPVLPPGFSSQVAEWLALLDRRGASRCVRWLVVTQADIDSNTRPSDPGASHMNLIDSDDEIKETPDRQFFTGVSDDAESDESSRTVQAVWQRLSMLIGHLPALTDLVWDCSWRVPSSIEGLLQARQSLRLHAHTFWFANHIDERAERYALQDLTLLRASNLRGVKTRSAGYKTDGSTDHAFEATLALVTGVNPAIRHVSFLTHRIPAYGSPAQIAALRDREQRAIWPGFAHAASSELDRAKLSSLEIGGIYSVEPSFLREVFQKCHLAGLRVLKLRVSYKHKGLRLLGSTLDLPALEVLVIGTVQTLLPGDELSDQNLAADFLRRLPALRAIRFVQDIDEGIFCSILLQHGRTLRRLRFPPPVHGSGVFFDPRRIARLQQACPVLEELAISIPRSLGDETEVEIYETLGTFSRLRHLALTLDCEDASLDLEAENHDPTPICADFDDFDREEVDVLWRRPPDQGRVPRNGHVRHAMMNAALDRTLATSIFKTIAGSKPGRPTDLPLQRLELRPERGIYFYDSVICINHLSKWWLIEHFAGSPDLSDLVVSPLRSDGDSTVELFGGGAPPATLEHQVEPIFRKLWPARVRPDSKWWEDWRSLPLRPAGTRSQSECHGRNGPPAH